MFRQDGWAARVGAPGLNGGSGAGATASFDGFSAAPVAASLVPNPVLNSALNVRVEYVGTMPGSQAGGKKTNAASPVSVGSQLLLTDQYGYRLSLGRRPIARAALPGDHAVGADPDAE